MAQLSSDGIDYPYGRIYYCPGTTGSTKDRMNEVFVQFLHSQVVQAPLTIDTSFFKVGHVDELITFLRAPSSHSSQGFKMLIASPRRAYSLIEDTKNQQGGGKDWPMLHESQMTRVQDFLQKDCPIDPDTNEYISLFDYNLRGGGGIKCVQEKIDKVLAILVGAFGLAIPPEHPLISVLESSGCSPSTLESAKRASAGTICDIIEVPVVFGPNKKDPRRADAVTVNMVNMVVMNDHCAVPKAYGPRNVQGADCFETALSAELKTLNYCVDWIRTWEYHKQHGGAHCGSNTQRILVPWRWWEYPNR